VTVAGSRRAAGFFLALSLGIIWCATAAAATLIDDSGSQALEPSVSMRWQTPTPGRRGTHADDALTGATRVRVHLDLTRWLHRSGHIYLHLPAQSPGPIDMSWNTQGRFSSGQLRSGNRMLVYAGPIESPVFEELFVFQLSVEGRLLDAATAVSYYFEMDED
jgi:hypothetical protein